MVVLVPVAAYVVTVLVSHLLFFTMLTGRFAYPVVSDARVAADPGTALLAVIVVLLSAPLLALARSRRARLFRGSVVPFTLALLCWVPFLEIARRHGGFSVSDASLLGFVWLVPGIAGAYVAEMVREGLDD